MPMGGSPKQNEAKSRRKRRLKPWAPNDFPLTVIAKISKEKGTESLSVFSLHIFLQFCSFRIGHSGGGLDVDRQPCFVRFCLAGCAHKLRETN